MSKVVGRGQEKILLGTSVSYRTRSHSSCRAEQSSKPKFTKHDLTPSRTGSSTRELETTTGQKSTVKAKAVDKRKKDPAPAKPARASPRPPIAGVKYTATGNVQGTAKKKKRRFRLTMPKPKNQRVISNISFIPLS